MLGRESSDELMSLLRRLAGHGISILFISHRLDEILAITHTVTVLRDGAVVGSHSTSQLSENDLIEALLGPQ